MNIHMTRSLAGWSTALLV